MMSDSDTASSDSPAGRAAAGALRAAVSAERDLWPVERHTGGARAWPRPERARATNGPGARRSTSGARARPGPDGEPHERRAPRGSRDGEPRGFPGDGPSESLTRISDFSESRPCRAAQPGADGEARPDGWTGRGGGRVVFCGPLPSPPTRRTATFLPCHGRHSLVTVALSGSRSLRVSARRPFRVTTSPSRARAGGCGEHGDGSGAPASPVTNQTGRDSERLRLGNCARRDKAVCDGPYALNRGEHSEGT